MYEGTEVCVRVLKCMCVRVLKCVLCVRVLIDRYYLNSSVGWLWRAHSL